MYFLFYLFSFDGKAEFSASLPQSSVSHDPSEIILICWFAVQEKFLFFISMLKTICDFFSGFFDKFHLKFKYKKK